ncbi:MAG: hypothetical protein ACRD0Q_05280 [Acidimicrobiales bacterium]
MSRPRPRGRRRRSYQPSDIEVTLAADVNQIDDTGFIWTFLGEAVEPERVRLGESIVHLDAVGIPEQAIDEFRHARLLPQ